MSLILPAVFSCHNGFHGVQLELNQAAQHQLHDALSLQLAQLDMCCLRCLHRFPGATLLGIQRSQSCGPRSAPVQGTCSPGDTTPCHHECERVTQCLFLLTLRHIGQQEAMLMVRLANLQNTGSSSIWRAYCSPEGGQRLCQSGMLLGTQADRFSLLAQPNMRGLGQRLRLSLTRVPLFRLCMAS